jgi:sarcosine oxidase
MTPWDAIVIGLGGVGSFALRALSKKTSNVLGIERFVRCHERGSSHGNSRIYRRAYFEHASYVPWIQYSMKQFRLLEQSQNVEIMQECGTLVMEEENSGGVVVARCLDAAMQHGIPVEKLSSNQLMERYPQFKVSKETVGLLEPGGGFLRPEVAMSAALNEAEAAGAEVWEETSILSITEVESEKGDAPPLVEVVVERSGEQQVVTAKSVVVSAGSWTAELIPSWAKQLKVTRQVQAWIDVSTAPDPSLYNPSNMPTWYMCATPKNPLPLYGIPADPKSDVPSHIKMGIHLRDVQVDPNEAHPTLSDEEWNELRYAAYHALRNAEEMPWPSAKPCLYTMSPDENFIIGQPAGSKRIYAVAGLSGHGFKMTPALGQMMADWALQQDTSHWNAEFVSPARFGI